MLSYWVLSKYRPKNGCIFNQSYCYILIIPGFGVITTTLSASSNKSVFGYLGIVQHFLLRIVKFCLSHMSRLILNSIIFKFLLLLIFLFLVYLGLGEKNSSYFVSTLVLFFIIYSSIKAKNKVKHILVFSLNLLFISSFWYIIGECFNLEIMYSFLGSYILLGFDDFDLSHDVESMLGLHYHEKCIGDTGGPGGDPEGGPDFSPYFCMDTSSIESDKGNNFNDGLKILQHNPALHNYKEYIEYENFRYKVSDLEIDIKEHNDNILYTKTNEFVFEKQEIRKYLEAGQKLNNYYSKSSNVTPIAYLNDIQNGLYEFTLEYNTLKKAKFFYENKGINLSKDYEVAFEIWQKRQIAISLNTYYNLKMQSLALGSHIPNWYDNSTVYDEVRENLIWVEYYLINIKAIYDGISAKKFNYFKLDNSEFDNFELSIGKSHYEKYKECRHFLNEYSMKSFDVDHMPKSVIEFWYKEVLLPDKEYYNRCHNEYGKVGLGLAEKFSKKFFNFEEYHNRYHSDSNLGLGLAEKFSKKNFNLTNYMSNLYKK